MPLLQVSRRVVETSHVVNFFCSFSTVFTLFASFGAPISDLSNFYISLLGAWCSDFWSFQLLYFQCLVPATQHLTVRPQPWDAEPRGCLSSSARFFNSKNLFLPHVTSYVVVGLHKHSRRPWGGRTCKAGEVSFCIMLVILQLMESVRIKFRKERKEDLIKVAVEKYRAE